MNARALLAAATTRLQEAGIASPDYDAAELLAFVSGVPRMQLGLVDVTPEQQTRYDE